MHSTNAGRTLGGLALATCSAAAAFAFVAGCESPPAAPSATGYSQSGVPMLTPAAAAMTPEVYVSHFQLQQQAAESADSSGGLRGMFREMRAGRDSNQIVGKLAGQIASDLRARGVHAKMLDPNDALPATGWRMRGEFMPLSDPNAGGSGGLGSGIGASFAERPVEVDVTVSQLVNGMTEPLFAVEAQNSVHGAGAPPIPNPYAAAAKFIVKQGTLESDAGKLSTEIADEFVRRMNARAAR